MTSIDLLHATQHASLPMQIMLWVVSDFSHRWSWDGTCGCAGNTYNARTLVQCASLMKMRYISVCLPTLFYLRQIILSSSKPIWAVMIVHRTKGKSFAIVLYCCCVPQVNPKSYRTSLLHFLLEFINDVIRDSVLCIFCHPLQCTGVAFAVCLSRWCIVPKWLSRSSSDLHQIVAQPF